MPWHLPFPVLPPDAAVGGGLRSTCGVGACRDARGVNIENPEATQRK